MVRLAANGPRSFDLHLLALRFTLPGQYVSFFLLLLITVGNLALGFGLAVHFGFGPDFSRLAAQWHQWRDSKAPDVRNDKPPA